MKKTLTVTTLALLAGAVSVYSQGQVSMTDVPGIQVYGTQATGNTEVTWGGFTVDEMIGNSGLDTTTLGTSSNYNASGGPTVSFTGAPAGAGFTAELLAGPTGSSVGNLAETHTLITSWFTTGQGLPGFWDSAVNSSVSGIAAGLNAAVAVAAWDGPQTSLAAAQAAGVPWGISNVGTATALGGGTFQPPNAVGLDSFDVVGTPEPSTIALGVMGASALLFRRRK